MTFITSDPTAIYRHALNAWVSPLATCALPKGVCYLLTYYLIYGTRGRAVTKTSVRTALPAAGPRGREDRRFFFNTQESAYPI